MSSDGKGKGAGSDKAPEKQQASSKGQAGGGHKLFNDAVGGGGSTKKGGKAGSGHADSGGHSDAAQHAGKQQGGASHTEKGVAHPAAPQQKTGSSELHSAAKKIESHGKEKGLFGMFDSAEKKVVSAVEQAFKKVEKEGEHHLLERQKHSQPGAGSKERLDLFDVKTYLAKRDSAEVSKEVKSAVTHGVDELKKEVKTVSHDITSFMQHLQAKLNPAELLMKAEQPIKTEQLVQSEQVTKAGRTDKPKGKVEHPENLSPQQRAAAGVTDYHDPKTNKHYKYDSQGRLTDLETQDGKHLKVTYNEKSEQPSSYVIEGKPPTGVIAQQKHDEQDHLKVDQKTGEVTSSHFETQKVNEGGKEVERKVRIEDHQNVDGSESKITFDEKGHRLSKEMLVYGGKAGPLTLGRYDYKYYDEHGKETNNVTDKCHSVETQSDAQGRPIHELHFNSMSDLAHRKASTKEDITYSTDANGNRTSHHEVYDLTKEKPALVSSTDKTVNKETGETSIDKKTYHDGQLQKEEQIQFNKQGEPASYHLIDKVKNFDATYTFENGKITDIKDKNKILTEQEKKELLKSAENSIESNKAKYHVDGQDGARETDVDPKLRANRRVADEHGVVTTYDNLGRVSTIDNKGQLTTVTYVGETNQPQDYKITRPGPPEVTLAHLDTKDDKHKVEVDQKTGVITVSDTSGKLKNETQYKPDGTIDHSLFDDKGRKLTTTNETFGAKGVEFQSKTTYLYSDDKYPNLPPDKVPYIAITQDKLQHTIGTEIYDLKSKGKDPNEKPSLVYSDKTTYTIDPKNPNLHTEQHTTEDMRGSSPVHRVSTVTEDVEKHTKVTTLDTTTADRTEHVKMVNGKATEFQIVQKGQAGQPDAKIDYVLNSDGTVKSVKVNGKPLDEQHAKGMKDYFTEVTKALSSEKGLNPADFAFKESDCIPTGARPGVIPKSGTFVWRDENKVLHQGTVVDGQILDKNKVAIGKIDDKGVATINGKEIKIADNPDAALFGVGSDNQRLSIVSSRDEHGYNGFLSNRDNTERHCVVGGNVFDKDGNFLGHYGADGKIEAPEGNPPTQTMGSRFNDYRFEGTQDGLRRSFTAGDDNTQGTIFLHGVKHTVENGMVINPATGEQVANFKPPANSAVEVNDKTVPVLAGGSLTMLDSGENIKLDDPRMGNCTFDVSVVGRQSAFKFATVPDAADPTKVHVVDLQPMIEANNQKIGAARRKEAELNGIDQQMGAFSMFNTARSIDMLSGAEQERQQSAAAAGQDLARLNNVLQTGHVDAGLLNEQQRDIDTARQKAEDAAAAQKLKEGQERVDKGLPVDKDPQGRPIPPEPPRIETGPPPLTKEKGEANTVWGKARIGNEGVEFEDGKVFKAGHKAGDQPIGKLGPGYVIQYNDGRQISLADTPRVLMQIRFGKDTQESYNIVGLGPKEVVGGQVRGGGLVDAKKLMEQANQDLDEANRGNLEYFKQQGWCHGITNKADGDLESVIKKQAETIQHSMAGLNREFDVMFGKDGQAFDPQKFDNTRVDQCTNAVQNMLNDCHTSAADAKSLGATAAGLEKQMDEAVATALMTVTGIGVANLISKAAEAGRLGALLQESKTALTAARFVGSTLAAGTAGAAWRYRPGQSASQIAGTYLEAATMNLPIGEGMAALKGMAEARFAMRAANEARSLTTAVSEARTLTSAANEARTLTNEARTAANEARSAANEARTATNEARSAANEARSAANEAGTAANEVRTAANEGKEASSFLSGKANYEAAWKQAELLVSGAKDAVGFWMAGNLKEGHSLFWSEGRSGYEQLKELGINALSMYAGHVLSGGLTAENMRGLPPGVPYRAKPGLMGWLDHAIITTPQSVLDAGLYSALDAIHQADAQGLQGAERFQFLIQSFGEGAAPMILGHLASKGVEHAFEHSRMSEWRGFQANESSPFHIRQELSRSEESARTAEHEMHRIQESLSLKESKYTAEDFTAAQAKFELARAENGLAKMNHLVTEGKATLDQLRAAERNTAHAAVHAAETNLERLVKSGHATEKELTQVRHDLELAKSKASAADEVARARETGEKSVAQAQQKLADLLKSGHADPADLARAHAQVEVSKAKAEEAVTLATARSSLEVTFVKALQEPHNAEAQRAVIQARAELEQARVRAEGQVHQVEARAAAEVVEAENNKSIRKVAAEGAASVEKAEKELEQAKRKAEGGSEEAHRAVARAEAALERARYQADSELAAAKSQAALRTTEAEGKVTRAQAEAEANQTVVRARSEVVLAQERATREPNNLEAQQALETALRGMHNATVEAGNTREVARVKSESEIATKQLEAQNRLELTNHEIAVQEAKAKLAQEPNSQKAKESVRNAEHQLEIARLQAEGKTIEAQAKQHFELEEAKAKANLRAAEENLKVIEQSTHADLLLDSARAELIKTRAEADLNFARTEAKAVENVLAAKVNFDVAELRAKLEPANEKAQEAALKAREELQHTQVRAEESLKEAKTKAEQAEKRAEGLLNRAMADVEGKQRIAQVEAQAKAGLAKLEHQLKQEVSQKETILAEAQVRLKLEQAKGEVSEETKRAFTKAEHELALERVKAESSLAVARAGAEGQVAAVKEEAALKSLKAQLEKDPGNKQVEYAMSLAEAHLALVKAQTEGKISVEKAEAALKIAAQEANMDQGRKQAEAEARRQFEAARSQARAQERSAQMEYDRRELAMRRLVGAAPAGTGEQTGQPVIQAPRPIKSGTQQRDISAGSDLKGMQSLTAGKVGAPAELSRMGETNRMGLTRTVDRESGLTRVQHPDGRALIIGPEGWKVRVGPDGSIIKIIDASGKAHTLERDAQGRVIPIDTASGIKVREDGTLTIAKNKGEMWVMGPDGKMMLARSPQEFFQKLAEAHSRMEEEVKAATRAKLREEQKEALLRMLDDFRQNAQQLNMTDPLAAAQMQGHLSEAMAHFSETLKDLHPESDAELAKAQDSLNQALTAAEHTSQRQTRPEGSAVKPEDREATREPRKAKEELARSDKPEEDDQQRSRSEERASQEKTEKLDFTPERKQPPRPDEVKQLDRQKQEESAKSEQDQKKVPDRQKLETSENVEEFIASQLKHAEAQADDRNVSDQAQAGQKMPELNKEARAAKPEISDEPPLNSPAVPKTEPAIQRGRVETDDSGRVKSVTALDGSRRTQFEYSTIPGEEGLFKVVLPYGTVLVKLNDTTWSKSGGANRQTSFRGRVEVTADGVLKVTDMHGETSIHPDGTRSVRNAAGGHYTERDGKVISMVDASGAERKFAYDTNGELSSVTITRSDGTETWTRASNHEWQVRFPNNDDPISLLGRFTFDESGKFSFEYAGGGVRSYSLDGSISSKNALGREAFQSADFRAELDLINHVVGLSIDDPTQRARIRTSIDFFMERAITSGIPEVERARALHLVRELLEAQGDHLPTTLQERRKLAEELLYQAAFPTFTDQGYNPTCNVTTAESWLYTRHPAEVMAMVKEIALTGRFTTARGEIIDFERPGEAVSLRPDREGIANIFSASGREHGLRTYASQIYQKMAVNIKWSAQSKAPDGTVITRGTVRYDGRHLLDARSGELLTPDEDPCIAAGDLPEIIQQIMGGAPPDCVVVHKQIYNTRVRADRQIDSPQMLADVLLNMSREGKIPAIIQVHTFCEPFWTDSHYGGAGGSGGWHVVNVVGIEVRVNPDNPRPLGDVLANPRPDEIHLKIDNQWGKGVDHVLHTVSLREVYEATLPPGALDQINSAEQRSRNNPADFGLKADLLRYKREAAKDLVWANSLVNWEANTPASVTRPADHQQNLREAIAIISLALDDSHYKAEFTRTVNEARDYWKANPAKTAAERIERERMAKKLNKMAERIGIQPPFDSLFDRIKRSWSDKADQFRVNGALKRVSLDLAQQVSSYHDLTGRSPLQRGSDKEAKVAGQSQAGLDKKEPPLRPEQRAASERGVKPPEQTQPREGAAAQRAEQLSSGERSLGYARRLVEKLQNILAPVTSVVDSLRERIQRLLPGGRHESLRGSKQDIAREGLTLAMESVSRPDSPMAKDLLAGRATVEEAIQAGASNIAMYHARVSTESGEHQVILRALSSKEDVDRPRTEMAASELSKTLGFENGGTPETVLRNLKPEDLVSPGQDLPAGLKVNSRGEIPVYLQENAGTKTVEEFFGSERFASYDLSKPQDVERLMNEHPDLRSQLEQAFLERIILGDWDMQSLNFVVSEQDGKLKVRNIDLEFAFKSRDMPRWQIDQSQGVNAAFLRYFSERALEPSSRQKTSEFVNRFDNEAGKRKLTELGLGPEQIDNLLGRARWFAEKGTFPPAELQQTPGHGFFGASDSHAQQEAERVQPAAIEDQRPAQSIETDAAVTFRGEDFTVIGLDENSGDVILRRRHPSESTGFRDKPSAFELANDYRTIAHQGSTYLCDAEGRLYVRIERTDPETKEVSVGLIPVPELQLAQREHLQVKEERATDSQVQEMKSLDTAFAARNANLQEKSGNVRRDADGRPVEVTDSSGCTYTVTRNSAGEITQIRSSTEKWEKGRNGEWTYNDFANKKGMSRFRGESRPEVQVRDDGTIWSRSANGTEWTKRPDGSLEKKEPSGRTTLLKVAPELERERASSLLILLASDSVQRSRLEEYMQRFEQRQPLSEQEKGRVYRYIAELLEAPPARDMDQRTRLHIVEEMLKNLANPLSITQGQHNTCNVTTQEVRMCLQEPAEYVRFIKDISLHGKYITRDGTEIVVANRATNMDREALMHWGASLSRFVPAAGPAGLAAAREIYRQLPFMHVDPERNLASQIFQVGAVNVFSQRQTRAFVSGSWAEGPRGSLRYRQEAPDLRVPGDTGERLVYVDSSGNEQLLAREPSLLATDIDTVFAEITGRQDDSTFFQPFVMGHDVPIAGRSFTTADELTGLLLRRQEQCEREGKPFCATIQVDTFHEPFYSDSGAGAAGGSGGAHVVNVIGIHPDGRGGYTVEVDNSWRRQSEHHGDSALSLEDLFLSTHRRTSQEVIEALRTRAASQPENYQLQLDLIRHEYERSEAMRKALAEDPSLSLPSTRELLGSRLISFEDLYNNANEILARYANDLAERHGPDNLPPEFTKFTETVRGILSAAERAEQLRQARPAETPPARQETAAHLLSPGALAEPLGAGPGRGLQFEQAEDRSVMQGSLEKDRAETRALEQNIAKTGEEQIQLDVHQQQNRLEKLIGEHAQKELFVHFRNDLNIFLERGISQGLTRQEIAATLSQVSRLLEANGNHPVSYEHRVRLAEQILYQAAVPHSIDQGRNPTCNVTTVEVRLFSRNPSEIAKMIVDVALKGHYVTASGARIEFNEPAAGRAITPDAAALSSMYHAEKFASGLFMKSYEVGKKDMERSFATEIANKILPNVLWSKAEHSPDGKAVNPGDLRWDGKNVINKATGEIIHEGFPGTFIRDLHVIYNEVTGRHEPDFVLANPRSYEEMLSQLEDMRQQGGFPIVMKVHTDNEPFGRITFDNATFMKMSEGKIPNAGGWHVVSILDMTYHPCPDGTYEVFVSIDNQHGKGSERIVKRVPLNELFLTNTKPTNRDHIDALRKALDENPSDLRMRMELARCMQKLTENIQDKAAGETNAHKREKMLAANARFMIDSRSYVNELKSIIAEANKMPATGPQARERKYIMARAQQLLKAHEQGVKNEQAHPGLRSELGPELPRHASDEGITGSEGRAEPRARVQERSKAEIPVESGGAVRLESARELRSTDIDGRNSSDNVAQRDWIKNGFRELTPDERKLAREAVIKELKEVQLSPKTRDAAGRSVYDLLMADSKLSDAQKLRILDALAQVREHYTSLRGPDGKMLPDQEVNWIHTQGEFARVLEAGNARDEKGDLTEHALNAQETEYALLASMFSDSAKYTDSNVTRGNFTTHHLDGALAAHTVLTRMGYTAEQLEPILQAIREHQIAPPQFMAQIYGATIGGVLDAQLNKGIISKEQYDELKSVLDSMTVVGEDKVPRIRKIAEYGKVPLERNDKWQYEVSFTPEERQLLKLAGVEHWYMPSDPRLDSDFAKLPAFEQEKLISRYKVAHALIDGDCADNYATMTGAAKIVKIRGPETAPWFKDPTVWDSIASVDKSFLDSGPVFTEWGRKQATRAISERDKFLHDSGHGIRAQMDDWLAKHAGKPELGKVPFYDVPLKYPEPLTAGESARMKVVEERLRLPELAESEKAQAEQELKSLRYKGLNDEEIKQFEFAKEIRDHMVDLLRQSQRTDGQPPSGFEPVRGRVLERTEEKWTSGRFRTAEQERLSELGFRLIAEKIGYPEAQRFERLLQQFESNGKLTDRQKDEVYSNISRLLRATDGESQIPLRDRLIIVDSFLRNVIDPTSIGQGRYFTCNATTIEVRSYVRNPEAVARLLAEVALTGKFVTKDGTTVELNFADLLMDIEASQQHQPDSYRYGHRNYASELFQMTAINVKYAGLNAETSPPGKIRYEQVPGVGERLMNYGKTPPEVLDTQPEFHPRDFQEVYNQIHGGSENDFFVGASLLIEEAPGAVKVGSPDELHEYLKQATADGKLPVIVAVDANKEPFSSFGVKNNEGIGSHVVTVHNYDPITRKVEVDNQGGHHVEFLGDRALSLDVLFNAMSLSEKTNRVMDLLEKIESLGGEEKAPTDLLLETFREMYQSNEPQFKDMAGKNAIEFANNTMQLLKGFAERWEDLSINGQELEAKSDFEQAAKQLIESMSLMPDAQRMRIEKEMLKQLKEHGLDDMHVEFKSLLAEARQSGFRSEASSGAVHPGSRPRESGPTQPGDGLAFTLHEPQVERQKDATAID